MSISATPDSQNGNVPIDVLTVVYAVSVATRTGGYVFNISFDYLQMGGGRLVMAENSAVSYVSNLMMVENSTVSYD